jgi:N-acetylmuramoyl-L-alanine amidase/LysM repeat protein
MDLVVLDPGHDRATGGKRSPDSTLLEYEFNQSVVDMAEQLLIKQGIKVVKTKTMDYSCGSSSSASQNADLYRRCKVANDIKAPLFISVHGNAASNAWSTAKGWEVYHYPGSSTGKALADLAVKHVYPEVKAQGVGIHGTAVKAEDFCVIRETKMPAILIEFAFFSNQEECAKMKTQVFRMACAVGIAKLVMAYFGKSYNAQPTPAPTPTPKPAPTPAPTPKPSTGSYTVAKGDTLWGISQKFGVTVDAIKNTNGLKSDTLSIGQVLKMPSKTAPTPTPTPAKPSLPTTHVVAKGDTLWGISQKFGVTVDSIKSDNGLKSDTLSIGQKLSIGGKAVVEPAPTPKPVTPPPTPTPEPTKPTFVIPAVTPILGKPVLTAAQLDTFARKVNSNAPKVAEYYVNIGKEWGIRGDLAFLQAIKETGYFRYGGDVKPEQNNYCGLGTVGGGVAGASFPTPRQGVIAHLQHLWAYATTKALPTTEPLLDPRFGLVTKGVAPTFEQLAGRWAVPGFSKTKYSSMEEAYKASATYGQEILALFALASKVVVSPEVVDRQDGSDKTEPTTRGYTNEAVMHTVCEAKGKSIKAVVIANNGYVDASDVAEMLGLKALYDNVEKKIIFVDPTKLGGK